MGERTYEKGESVSRAGLTVHQLYTESEFEVPSVVLKLVSSRDEPVFVRLVVPDLTTDRIGFHADFEGDSWSVEDGQLVFEAELDPDSEVTTLYAVESGGTETIGSAMESLQIDAVESLDSPETGGDQLLGEDESTSVAEDPVDESEFEAIVDEDDETLVETAEELDIGTDPDETLVDPDDIDSGTAPGETGADTDTETAFESNSETAAGSVEFEAQLDDLGTGESAQSDSSEDESTHTDRDETGGVGDGDTVSSEENLAAIPTGTLVEELTARLDSEELTPQQRRQIRNAGFEPEAGRSDVRDEQISQLQARVSDVETFTDAIERLFEEYGPPEEVFAEYDEQLDRLESRVEELDQLEGSLDGVQERIQAVEDAVEDVEGTVENVEDSVEDVEATVDRVESEVQETSDAVETVQDSQAELESEMEDVQRWRKKVTNALQAIMGE